MTTVLSLDVSGNFKEGKGTTGYCELVEGEPKYLGELKAEDYISAEAYWQAHLNLISEFAPDVLVMEGYRLYNHKGQAASKQANSELETPQLIGVIKVLAFQNKIPLHIQFAHEVKSRWSEKVLVAKGILEERNGRYYFDGLQSTNDHKRDALKHALHYWRYKHGE